MSQPQQPLVTFAGVSKSFVTQRPLFRPPVTTDAIVDLDLDIIAGTTLGLVGESGSGKSTTARLLAKLTEPDHGSITFDGHDLAGLRGKALHEFRREVQMIFQSATQSLDPRMTVAALVREPLDTLDVGPRSSRTDRVRESLAQVGLGGSDIAERYPAQLSGGQRQRVAIAKALATGPRLIICDEPVTALDVSIQAQILNLLLQLQETHGFTYLFIAHDLAVVRQLSHRVGVMYRGHLVEVADAETFFERPAHPYAEALLSAGWKGETDRERIVLPVGSHEAADVGCVFASRCWKAQDICRIEPELLEIRAGHRTACHFPASPAATAGGVDTPTTGGTR